jgi:esterase/lipase superfamily enzyme
MHRSSFVIAHAFSAAIVLATLLAAAPSLSTAQNGTGEVSVPFLTLRNQTGAEDPADFYGDERSGLKAGLCHLRELDFSVLTPLTDAAPSFVREEFLRVDQVTEKPVPALLDELQEVGMAGETLLYVHGYHISFEKGCRRAALFRENAGLEGRLLWFSWPSDGALASYTHDEADLYWSVPDLADAIIELDRRASGGAVDVIGHSLGARGVVIALYDVANRRPDIRLGEIVLLAPDMDFGIFERILPRISPIAENITVYVAEGDRPLALSASLHGYPRLGQAGNDVATLAGIEVIDVTDLPAATPTGHIYHIYSDVVGDDIDQLLNEGKRAGQRRNLIQAGINLWRLQPPQDVAE